MVQQRTRQKEQEKQVKEDLSVFESLSDILAVPRTGKPLPPHRRWKLPCPDEKAFVESFDDCPEDRERRERWRKEWTTCEDLTTTPLTVGNEQLNP